MNTLSKAAALIEGERMQDYGPPEKSFRRLAVGWTEIVGVEIDSKQVALMLAWMKISRLTQNSDHEDSWVDLAAYGGIGGDLP